MPFEDRVYWLLMPAARMGQGLAHDTVIGGQSSLTRRRRKEQPATPDSLCDSLERRISGNRSRGVFEMAPKLTLCALF